MDVGFVFLKRPGENEYVIGRQTQNPNAEPETDNQLQNQLDFIV